MTISEARELVDKYTTVKEYTRVILRNDAYEIVGIMQAEIDELAAENAQLSAKIFAYEAILQNSNFKMAVIKNKKDEE